MSSKCSVLRDITHLLQKVDDLLSSPRSLNRLQDKFISLRGAIRALPINRDRKKDILRRLDQAISILQRNGILDRTSIILVLSQILQTIRLKIEDLTIPCPQGIVTVHPSNTFSTICNFCK